MQFGKLTEAQEKDLKEINNQIYQLFSFTYETQNRSLIDLEIIKIKEEKSFFKFYKWHLLADLVSKIPLPIEQKIAVTIANPTISNYQETKNQQPHSPKSILIWSEDEKLEWSQEDILKPENENSLKVANELLVNFPEFQITYFPEFLGDLIITFGNFKEIIEDYQHDLDDFCIDFLHSSYYNKEQKILKYIAENELI